MNKSFINKQNGIKRNVINNVVLALTLLGLVLCGVLGGTTTASAKTALKTYTQPFQNNTTSLSGQSVEMSTYFIKMDLGCQKGYPKSELSGVATFKPTIVGYYGLIRRGEIRFVSAEEANRIADQNN